MTNKEYVKQYIEDVGCLYGIVEEMFTTNMNTLLSPVFRRLVLKQALKVKEMHQEIAPFLEIPSFLEKVQTECTCHTQTDGWRWTCPVCPIHSTMEIKLPTGSLKLETPVGKLEIFENTDRRIG